MTEEKPEHVKTNEYATAEEIDEFQRTHAGNYCWNCEYFDPTEDITVTCHFYNGELVLRHFEYDGLCRRHTPIVHVDDDGEVSSMWPLVVGCIDWCGEYVRD